MTSSRSSHLLSAGFTLFEVLVVIAIIGILSAIAIPGFDGLQNQAGGAASVMSGALSAARTQAMSTTSAVRVTFNTAAGLTVDTGPLCGATTGWNALPSLNEPVPDRVTITPDKTPWQICFSSRGLASDTRSLSIKDKRNRTAQVQIYLSGAVVTQ